MTENCKYIKARIKTYEQLVKVYPETKSWGKPLDSKSLLPSADEVLLPYLGRTVWLRKKRIDLCQIYFEIKDTDGWVVLPEWIEYFDTADMVAPAK